LTVGLAALVQRDPAAQLVRQRLVMLLRGEFQGFAFHGQSLLKPAEFRIGGRQCIQHIGPFAVTAPVRPLGKLGGLFAVSLQRYRAGCTQPG